MLAISLLALGCVSSPRTRRPLPPGAIDICETCVGELEGHRIGVSNIWARKLAGPNGIVRLQSAAVLSIWRAPDPKRPDEPARPSVTVVVDSEVRLDDATYRVLWIEAPPHEPGSIVLARVVTR